MLNMVLTKKKGLCVERTVCPEAGVAREWRWEPITIG